MDLGPRLRVEQRQEGCGRRDLNRLLVDVDISDQPRKATIADHTEQAFSRWPSVWPMAIRVCRRASPTWEAAVSRRAGA